MDVIAKNLNQAFLEDKIDLLRHIAQDYGLDTDDLIEKYIKNDERPRKSFQKKQKQDYIETEEFAYNGTKYLVDMKNQVYSYNIERPMMIGERLIDGSIKFFDGYFKQQSLL